MQQQQPQGQYPGYQQPPATDNMYGMAADPQSAMAAAGMNDMSAWGGGGGAQASPYGAPGMAYNHSQMQQHQRQPQAG